MTGLGRPRNAMTPDSPPASPVPGSTLLSHVHQAGAIHIWYVSSTTPPWSATSLWETLSEHERTTLRTNSSPNIQQASIFRYGLTRMILSYYLDIPPTLLAFTTDHYGKYSLSHCGVSHHFASPTHRAAPSSHLVSPATP